MYDFNNPFLKVDTYVHLRLSMIRVDQTNNWSAGSVYPEPLRKGTEGIIYDLLEGSFDYVCHSLITYVCTPAYTFISFHTRLRLQALQRSFTRCRTRKSLPQFPVEA